MDIAGRDGDRTGCDACARLLERRSIRAAALEDFTLRGNAEQLRRLFEAVADRRRADDRAIHDLDGRAAAHLDRHRGLHLGQVARVGHINGDRYIRLDRERRRACATQTDLLLCREHEIQVVFGLGLRQLLHHQQERHAADAVVEVRTAEHAVLLEARRFEYGKVADLDELSRLFGVLCADVDEHMREGHVLHRGLFLEGDHAARAVGEADGDVHEIRVVQAADLREADKAVLVDIGRDNADRVHVRGEQYLFAGALFAADQVAERVGRNVVNICACDACDGLAYRVLTAGRAECAAYFLP